MFANIQFSCRNMGRDKIKFPGPKRSDMSAGIYMDPASQYGNSVSLDVQGVMTGQHMGYPEGPMRVSQHLCGDRDSVEIFISCQPNGYQRQKFTGRLILPELCPLRYGPAVLPFSKTKATVAVMCAVLKNHFQEVHGSKKIQGDAIPLQVQNYTSESRPCVRSWTFCF